MENSSNPSGDATSVVDAGSKHNAHHSNETKTAEATRAMEPTGAAINSLDSHKSTSEHGVNNDSSMRTQLGSQLSNVTDLINSNLVVLRYATISTVFLLGAYGIANTPLFYRYKNVMDIPTKYFIRRKWIYGRIVGLVENTNNVQSVHTTAAAGRMQSLHQSVDWNTATSSSTSPKQAATGLSSLFSSSLQKSLGNEHADKNESRDSNATTPSAKEVVHNPIVVLFRHSSPMERLLTQSAFDKLMAFTGSGGKSSPSRLLYSSANPHRNLLPIELAGVMAPPTDSTAFPNQLGMLHQLIEKKANVSLQLLALRTVKQSFTSSLHNDHNPTKLEDRPMPLGAEMKNTAICHLRYRQPGKWFTKLNAGLELVTRGEACVSSSGMVIPLSATTPEESAKQSTFNDQDKNETGNRAMVTNYIPTVKQLQNDTNFMSELEQAEYSAWKSKLGMWSSHHARELRREYAEEEEYSKRAFTASNVWGWMKKGWRWMRKE